MSSQIYITGELEKREAKHELRQGRAGCVRGRGRWAWLCAAALWGLIGSASALRHMTLQYTWGTFDFAFDSEQQRRQLTARPDFAPYNSTPFDFDWDYKGRFFLAFPSVVGNPPVALATVKDRWTRDSPQLAPYPDWSWHAGQRGCDGMTSVFRIYIDKCHRLWAIDCGIVDISGSYTQKCPPQLLVFDLRTDTLIARHRFNISPEYNASALLLNVVAEQLGYFCTDNAFAYVADSGSFALYVFSLRSQRSWRIESDTFRPDSNATRFEVNGVSFTLEDGIMGMTQNDNCLFYHAFSSFKEGRVPKRVLREEALFNNGSNRASEEFQIIGKRLNQSAGYVLAKNSVMFFHQMGTNSIYCWDTSTAYASVNHHTVEHDDTLLHFVTSMKSNSEEVWAIDNNGQNLFAGTFKPNVSNTVNIVRGSVRKLSSNCKRGLFGW